MVAACATKGVVAEREPHIPPWPDDRVAVPLEAQAGDLVCFHGLLPHYSAPNRSARSRHAYTLHATDARTIYSPANWIQRADDLPVRGFD